MRASLAAVLIAVLLVACGSSRHRPVVCVPSARATLAAHLQVPVSAVSHAVNRGNNGSPQCVLTVRRAGERPVQVTVNLDDGPQAYFRLERTAVEASQQFGTVRLYAPPQQIPGLGIEADWFPDADNVETTDGARLITVTVTWPGSKQAERRDLAEALARPFLRRPHGGATGYPSG